MIWWTSFADSVTSQQQGAHCTFLDVGIAVLGPQWLIYLDAVVTVAAVTVLTP
jgi:hypothetical protein